MSNMTTTADLLDDALTKIGEKIDGTSDYESDALTYMNTFYKSILAGGNEFNVELGEQWVWAKAANPGVLTLRSAYTTGTVSLTQESVSGAFSVAPASSQVGKMLKITDRSDVFRVTAHVAGATAFTLDDIYTDLTSTALNFKLYTLDYALVADAIRQIGPLTCYRQQSNVDDEGKIYGQDLASFNRQFPLHRLEEGIPTHFAIKANAGGVITLRMSHSVAELTRVEYDYIPLPVALTDSATSIPLVPIEHRQVLSYMTSYALCVDKEDTKADHFFKLSQAKLQAMVQATRKEQLHVSKDRGRLIPRRDQKGNTRWPTQA